MLPLTSSNLEKIPSSFSRQELPEGLPGEKESIIVIADVPDIKRVNLPAEELHFAAKLRHLPSRERYLAGRYLLRGLLSRWMGIAPESFRMERSPSGKPLIRQQGFPHVSMSHTARTVGIVFSHSGGGDPDVSPGIDLELERTVDAVALARRFFSEEEATLLAQSSSRSDFFRFWCCREAAIKGDGRGMGRLLAGTRIITPGLPNSERMEVSVDGAAWDCFAWRLRGGLHGAVAFRHPPDVIRWCDLREGLG